MISSDNIILVLLLHLGLFAHFLTKIVAAKTHKTGRSVCVTDYFRAQPIQTLLSVVAAWAFFLVFYGTPELTRLSALSLGFTCDRIFDAVGEGYLNRLRMGGRG